MRITSDNGGNGFGQCVAGVVSLRFMHSGRNEKISIKIVPHFLPQHIL